MKQTKQCCVIKDCAITWAARYIMGLAVIHRFMFKLRPDVNNRMDKGFTRRIFPLMSDPEAAGSLSQSNWFPTSLSHCVKNLTGITKFSNHLDKKYFWRWRQAEAPVREAELSWNGHLIQEEGGTKVKGYSSFLNGTFAPPSGLKSLEQHHHWGGLPDGEETGCSTIFQLPGRSGYSLKIDMLQHN